MQYVLQRRHDDRQGKLTPDVGDAGGTGARRGERGLLLDHDEDTWHDRIRLGRKDTVHEASG
jgi:hypothetical protein